MGAVSYERGTPVGQYSQAGVPRSCGDAPTLAPPLPFLTILISAKLLTDRVRRNEIYHTNALLLLVVYICVVNFCTRRQMKLAGEEQRIHRLTDQVLTDKVLTVEDVNVVRRSEC